jgi:hypothetical protein
LQIAGARRHKQKAGWILMKQTIFILALLLPFAVQAQWTRHSLQQQLDKYTDHFEPEQVDVHLDKQVYFAGDHLWYAIYLNSIPRAASSMSSIAYFEIRSENDSLILRQKTRCKNGLGHGDLVIPRQLPTGTYKIAVYTLWMKNAQEAFTRSLAVINLDIAPVEFIKPAPSIISVSAHDTRKVNFSVRNARSVFVADHQDVFFFSTLNENPKGEFEVDISQANGSWIYLVAMDAEGHALESKSLLRSTSAGVSVRPARTSIAPRDRNEATIELLDEAGRPMAANVSVSIFPKAARLESPAEMSSPDFLSGLRTEMNSREVFIYPASERTLPPVSFSARGLKPGGLNTDSTTLRAILNDIGVKKKVMRVFESPQDLIPEPNYLLQANNTYMPRDYSNLSTLPEFLREIVPMVRVRKSKAGRKLYVRNSDNPSNIYFFKEPALILVDGAKIDDVERLLALPLHEIESIGVLWGINEINKSGLFSLADYGVVSVQTRSRTTFPGSQQLFQGLQQPMQFSRVIPELKDSTKPVFTDLLYWNPSIRISGRERISFRASDDLRTWIIEVKGITDEGDPIHALSEFTVTQDNP